MSVHRHLPGARLAEAVVCNGIAWLAKKFAPHQVALEPGQIILAGSFTRPVKVKAGDTIHVDYGSLGNISTRFV